MSENEQDQYGTQKAAQPIPVEIASGAYVVSTPSPTANPDPTAMQAYQATVRRDLIALREQRHGESS